MFLHAPFIQNKLLWSLLSHKTKICRFIIYPILNMHRKGLTLHTRTWNVHHLLNCFRRPSISAVSWLLASSVLSIYSKTVTITSKKNTLQIWHYLFNWDNNVHVNTMYASYLNINTNYVTQLLRHTHVHVFVHTNFDSLRSEANSCEFPVNCMKQIISKFEMFWDVQNKIIVINIKNTY